MSDPEKVLQEKIQAMRQRYSQVADELKHELSSLQESYRQLGQRASTLASERNALRASLDEARQCIDSDKADLGTLKEEHDQMVHDLQSQLVTEQEVQQSLREEIENLTRQYEEKLEQSAPLEDQIAGLQASVQKSLLRENKLLHERDTVVRKLTDADEKRTATKKERRAIAEQLDRLRKEFENSRNGYLGQIATLEERIVHIESERDEKCQHVVDLEAALFELSAHQVEELEHALQRARDTVNDIESATAGHQQGDPDKQDAETSPPEEPNDEHSEEQLMYTGNASTP